MRLRITALLLAAAFGLPAQAIEITHTQTGDKAQPERPMEWRYRALAAGLDAFERRAPDLAPHASLRFELPRRAADPAQVQLVRSDDALDLPVDGDSFALPRDARAASDDAMVRASRHFAAGEYVYPRARVRSDDLPANVRRLGDLRLGCEVEVSVARSDKMALRLLFGATRLFGVDVCSDMPLAQADKPRAAFDSILLDDGARKMTLAANAPAKETVKLGDPAWGNDTRIVYLKDGRPLD